jgi:glycosyltransferase involved in cell wall biosynthesis
MHDSSANVLHVIQRLSSGGAARALIAAAKYSAQTSSFGHSVISLSPADRGGLELASQAGLKVLSPNVFSEVFGALADADIVHFHYWNSPELNDLWSRRLPPMRSLVWSEVNGQHPPHLITREVIDMADIFVAASPVTLELDLVKSMGCEKTDLVFAGADFARLDDISAEDHAAFNIGYIGTIDFAKMHPKFVAMSADVDVPNAHFILCGAGKAIRALKEQIRDLGNEARFEILDYVQDIRRVLARLDVFGYPLSEDNYSASELVLQEVMYAGVPSVVLPFGGAAHLIVHGETGLVAEDEREYARAIESLYHHPDERARLGRNAAVRAKQLFGARNCAKKFNRIYAQLLRRPKGARRSSSGDLAAIAIEQGSSNRGAALLVRSLGDRGGDFRASLAAVEEHEVLAAEARISSTAPAFGDCILDYRNHFPTDKYLALWSGLVLLNRERPALAAAALRRAIELGCDHWRAQWYFARAARAAGATAVAETALAAALMGAPQLVTRSRP